MDRLPGDAAPNGVQTMSTAPSSAPRPPGGPLADRAGPVIATASRYARRLAPWAAGSAVIAAMIAVGGLLAQSLLSEDAPQGVAAGAVPQIEETADASAPAALPPNDRATLLGPRLATEISAPSPAEPAPSPVMQAEEPVLAVDDARWAREVVAKPNLVPALARRVAEMQAFADEGAALPVEPAETVRDDQLDAAPETDPERTAAVPPATPPAAAKPEAPGAPQANRPPAGTGRMTSAANLRARPENGAAVVTTIASGAEVQIVACEAWCEIVHDGRRGYVFGKFVRQGDAPAAAATVAAKPADATAAPQPAPASKPKIVPAAAKPPLSMRDENLGR
ncbi:MAG: SH3 domain-containing protein [Mesorhizobium sp.]|nr:SH3 domain-containing protein [Mesorhizobium sp.]